MQAANDGAAKVNYFNSIKVRLKPYNNEHLPTIDLFQFHKGTIKT